MVSKCFTTSKQKKGRKNKRKRKEGEKQEQMMNRADDESMAEQKDSTTGKLMEKAGNMLHEDGMAEKGRAKREEAREEAGLTSDDTSY